MSDLLKHVTTEDLSDEEKIRASKILHQNDKDLFISSRTFLRKLLGNFLQIEPYEIKFKHNTFGKPYIDNSSDLKFNITHSEDMILFGFILKSELGIDVEYLKRPIAMDKVSNFLFSKNELVTFENTKEEFRQEKLIDHWTRKEAILKAKGMGLSVAMNGFEIPFQNEKDSGTYSTVWIENKKHAWFLKSFDIPFNYRAAVAVCGQVDSFELINIDEIRNTL